MTAEKVPVLMKKGLSPAPAELQVEAAQTLYRCGKGSQAEVFAARGSAEQLRDGLAQVEREVRGDLAAIRFYPDGSSSGGSIELGAEGVGFQVTVDWLTGGVDVARLGVE